MVPVGKAIVKYDKRFCKFSGFSTLSKIDQDLFYSVLSIVRDRKMKETVISLKEIIDRSKYASKNQAAYTYKTLDKAIAQMVLNVHDFAIIKDSDEMIGVINLFETFVYDKNGKNLLVSLGHRFSNFFFDIPENQAFTQFPLDTFLPMKSGYAKSLYRLLLDRFYGFTMSIEDFYNYFGVTSGPSKKQLLFRLKDFITEIQKTEDFLDDPPISYTLNRLSPRKNSRIISISFDFAVNPGRNCGISKPVVPDAMAAMENEPSAAVIESLPNCPHCGGKLVYRENSKSGKTFIGHENYKTSNCSMKSYNSKEELEQEICIVEEKKKKLEEAKDFAKHDKIGQLALAAAREAKRARMDTTYKFQEPAVSEEYVDNLFANLLKNYNFKTASESDKNK